MHGIAHVSESTDYERTPPLTVWNTGKDDISLISIQKSFKEAPRYSCYHKKGQKKGYKGIHSVLYLNRSMASSDKKPSPTPAIGLGSTLPGKPTTLGSKLIESGAMMLQSMAPVRQMNLHACTFALYGHDLSRQIETHHFIQRINQDFLQCAVFDSDKPSARLIGVEYIVSDNIFETLPSEEQKLWHSHAYEIKTGLWTLPGMPELLQDPEHKSLTKTYGKFWCTWQVDRGDRLPLGAPSLMMSAQAVDIARVNPELVKRRDRKYGVSRGDAKESRVEMAEPEWINPNADYWKQHGKGFAIDVVPVEMKSSGALI
ncbi:Oil body-associated protein 2B [Rhynchospora pubera]|uniref:Oil body-associated protein 2B n=1 Tax=Rhynchospora pubera TaxID=906938 RepID=A0AAV8F7I8_9POAL|nr:Oil body-associated protein 2B [Rhynchospora pubera]